MIMPLFTNRIAVEIINDDNVELELLKSQLLLPVGVFLETSPSWALPQAAWCSVDIWVFQMNVQQVPLTTAA